MGERLLLIAVGEHRSLSLKVVQCYELSLRIELFLHRFGFTNHSAAVQPEYPVQLGNVGVLNRGLVLAAGLREEVNVNRHVASDRHIYQP